MPSAHILNFPRWWDFPLSQKLKAEVFLSAIIFTKVSKVEMGQIIIFFETHDIISTI